MYSLRAGSAVATIAIAVGVTAYWSYQQYSRFCSDAAELSKLLDEEVDSLSTDFVCDEGHHTGMLSQAIVVYNHTAAAVGVVSATREIVNTVRGVAALNNAPVDVDCHRQVKHRKRAPYMNTVIAECRLTFGVPQRSEANEKAVRRTAVRIMKTHGVRPTHINSMLPKILESVFVPSVHDIQAREWSQSWPVWIRKWRWSSLAPRFMRC
jgi:predicted nicotinamide N-methyase